jgi:tRNA threonylcarbamoyladenosine biosynthesis protein TsaB
MTTILAIDCATGPCSVAIWDGSRIAAYVENLKPVMQSASLIPMVETALKQSGMVYKDIGLVAATVGPGSFTGIRVGLAAAKGIAYAANVPSRGFTTLDVLAFAARKQGGNILALLQAGKGEYYYQYTEKSPSVAAPQQIIAETPSLPVLIAGNVPLAADGFTSSDITFPRADALAELAASNAAYLELKPFYIRPPDAKLPAAANR